MSTPNEPAIPTRTNLLFFMRGGRPVSAAVVQRHQEEQALAYETGMRWMGGRRVRVRKQPEVAASIRKMTLKQYGVWSGLFDTI